MKFVRFLGENWTFFGCDKDLGWNNEYSLVFGLNILIWNIKKNEIQKKLLCCLIFHKFISRIFYDLHCFYEWIMRWESSSYYLSWLSTISDDMRRWLKRIYFPLIYGSTFMLKFFFSFITCLNKIDFALAMNHVGCKRQFQLAI